MMCFRGNWDEFYGEALLLDSRRMTLTSEQGIKTSLKAAAIFQLVFSHLNLVEVQFFGLRFCDDKQHSVRLNKDGEVKCVSRCVFDKAQVYARACGHTCVQVGEYR
ncbi:hypothetical protein ATANTOWER_020967 [Ataeniobius toweri]|uniref:FERM N-terminal domain-containing protein n=1 Tax=Ataeniobius toweri TaxID=208326 RepID=A0ABU7C8P1_9TELE|nr:hypothetical protein [Ataeniobius toweri]